MLCRYLLSISCADHTGQIWLQGFNEVGELMLGVTAKELHDIYVRILLSLYHHLLFNSLMSFSLYCS